MSAPPTTSSEIHVEHRKNPFLEVAEELALAGMIVVGHGLLVALIIVVIWCTGLLLEATSHGDHPAAVGGVSARFLIEGGEIILVGIVLAVGILSAFVTLTAGLIQRLRR